MHVTVRESWTDERLDDLNHRVDDGFRRIDERFAQVDQRFAQVDARFDALQRDMNARFDALGRLMIQLICGLVGAFITAAMALVVTQL
jgi:catalase (peroxidase I)